MDLYKHLFLKGFFLLVLAGCAAVPRLPESPATFALKGKVAVQEAGENFTANLLWQQDGDGFQIDLAVFMGIDQVPGRIFVISRYLGLGAFGQQPCCRCGDPAYPIEHG